MNQKGGKPACCAVCKTETSRRCSRCLEVYYCNREHQREDWKRHKSECLPKLTEDQTPKGNGPIVHGTSTVTLPDHYADALVDRYPDVFTQLHKNETKEKTRKSKKKVKEVPIVHVVTEGKQTSNVRQSNNTGAPSSDLSVNKISELNLLQDSIVKSNLVYSRDVSNQSAITFEGSSEKEILSESAQQLNGLDYGKSIDDSVVKSVNNLENKMPLVPVYLPQPPHKVGHKEYPEGTIKGTQISNNILTDTSDPCYEICQRVIRDMTQYGVCVLDNFLGKDRGLLVLKEVLEMYQSGIFTAGQLVSNPGSTEAQTIRSDRITWLDGKEPFCNNIGILINYVDSIVLRANKMPNNGKMGDYVINGRTKAMVACYPGSGSHYVKHVDNPNKDGRCITAIYYLNVDWDVNQTGGLLRVFPEGTDTVANIQPIFDRMLFFWSDRRNPHEVQPAYATRYAITLWYFDSQEREEALRLYKTRANQASASK